MATTLKGYTFYITAQPRTDAMAAYGARYTQDDYRINSGARVYAARMRGQKVWAVQYLVDSKPTVYVTMEQATKFGLCVWHLCGKPATYAGFEGIRCGAHQKYGMSMLCTTDDCTAVSETGFSAHCTAHTTTKMRDAREAYQREQRARWAAPATASYIGWQRVSAR